MYMYMYIGLHYREKAISITDQFIQLSQDHISLSRYLLQVIPVNGTHVVSGVGHLLDVHDQSLLLGEVHVLHPLD